MISDDVSKGDVFLLKYYGVNVFLDVIDVFSDKTVEVVEMAREHLKNDDPKAKEYFDFFPEKEKSKTGHIEFIKHPYQKESRRNRLLYVPVNRVPYYHDEEKNNKFIIVPVGRCSLAYKKARVICKDKEKVRFFCRAYRIFSSLNFESEEYDKLYKTWEPYYPVSKRDIDKLDDEKKENLS